VIAHYKATKKGKKKNLRKEKRKGRKEETLFRPPQEGKENGRKKGYLDFSLTFLGIGGGKVREGGAWSILVSSTRFFPEKKKRAKEKKKGRGGKKGARIGKVDPFSLFHNPGWRGYAVLKSAAEKGGGIRKKKEVEKKDPIPLQSTSA